MNPLLEKIAVCVERGKVNIKSPYPPDLKGQEGADELARKALDEGLSAKNGPFGRPDGGNAEDWCQIPG